MNYSGGFSKDLVDAASKEDQRLSTLVDAYRKHGHKIAKINPIASTPSTQTSNYKHTGSPLQRLYVDKKSKVSQKT